MIDRFGERELIALSDRDDEGVINDAVLNRALEQADAEIEPYLVGRVQLPFESVPKVISGFACDVARMRLTSSDVTRTEKIENDYARAIKFFEQVRDGKIRLGLDEANEEVPEAKTVQFQTGTKVFARES